MPSQTFNLDTKTIEKAAEEMRNSEMEHTVSPNGGIHPPPPNGDLTSSIVPYDGARLSIGELVAQVCSTLQHATMA